MIIPQHLEQEALFRAFDKVTKENLSRRDLLSGDSLRTVFDRHGVL